MAEIWKEIWIKKGLSRTKGMENCNQVLEGKSSIILLIIINYAKEKNINVSKSQIFQNFLTTSCLIKFSLYPNIIPKPILFICICNHTIWEAKLWGSKGKSCLRKLHQTHSKNNKYDFCEKAIIANFSKYF